MKFLCRASINFSGYGGLMKGFYKFPVSGVLRFRESLASASALCTEAAHRLRAPAAWCESAQQQRGGSWEEP